jgi:hypothetical protein
MTKIRLVVKEIVTPMQRLALIQGFLQLINEHQSLPNKSVYRIHSVNRVFRFVLANPQVLSLGKHIAKVTYRKLESLERYLERKPMGRGVRTFRAQAAAIRSLYATQKLITLPLHPNIR